MSSTRFNSIQKEWDETKLPAKLFFFFRSKISFERVVFRRNFEMEYRVRYSSSIIPNPMDNRQLIPRTLRSWRISVRKPQRRDDIIRRIDLLKRNHSWERGDANFLIHTKSSRLKVCACTSLSAKLSNEKMASSLSLRILPSPGNKII